MYTVVDQKIYNSRFSEKQVILMFKLMAKNLFDCSLYKQSKGEMYNYLDIVLKLLQYSRSCLLLLIMEAKSIAVKGKDNIKGNLQLELPGNWSVSPQSIPLFR
jgi:hypothetical protein